jgi:hypothetical protein
MHIEARDLGFQGFIIAGRGLDDVAGGHWPAGLLGGADVAGAHWLPEQKDGPGNSSAALTWRALIGCRSKNWPGEIPAWR